MVKLRFFLLQLSVLLVMHRFLTVLTKKLKRDISTTTTSLHTQLVKQSHLVALADVKLVTVLWLNVLWNL